jgi:glycosyltransferase involved in cell wall biosynthesis
MVAPDRTAGSRPLVSVVIACFNHAQFLSEAIETVMAQTYAPIEIVVVDDGSTDNTAEVAKRYPVRLIQQPNQGLAAAGNAGIGASHGEFVMRLDADDRLKSTYVEETLKPLQHDPTIDFVYTQVEYFGARIGTYAVEEFDPETLAERNYIHASALMRRTSFDAVGGYKLDMRGLRCEDWDLWLSFAEMGLRGKLIARPLLQYRQYSGPSMVTIDFRSLAGLRRELAIMSRLHEHHPLSFAAPALLRRLARLPRRIMRRQASPRFAVMLTSFYGVLLVQHLLGRPKPRTNAHSLSTSD